MHHYLYHAQFNVGSGGQMQAGILLARNQDEAVGAAIRQCREKFPTAVNLQTEARLVEDDFVFHAAAEIRKAQPGTKKKLVLV